MWGLADSQLCLIVVSLTLALFIYVLEPQTFLRRRIYPPGPPGLPFLGNVLQISSTAWLDFTRWKKAHGSLIFIKLLGQPVLILNDHKVAGDLLDRRARIYSDRGRSIVGTETLTRGLLLSVARDGPLWHTMRKFAQAKLTHTVGRELRPTEENEAVLLAAVLLRDSGSWLSHIQSSSSLLQFGLVYGVSSEARREYARAAVPRINQFVDRVVSAMYPGAHLVELLPWMRHLPAWMMKWKRDAEYWFEEDSKMFEALFADAERLGDDDQQNFVSMLLSQEDRHQLGTRECAWLASTLFAGGSETTAGVLAWFVLAMVLHPEVQEKAHAQLDEVVGRSRLPNFDDYDNLTYIRAIVKEVLRWQPVSPIGLPHASTEDDTYEGHYIPKGTICIPNVWCMNRDADVYGPDADQFNPDRFLQDGKLKKAFPAAKHEGHATYGFGQRLCIGRHIANDVLFINVAVILWACNVGPSPGKDDPPIIPSPDAFVNTGLVMRPANFDCVFQPRFSSVHELLGTPGDDFLNPSGNTCFQ